MKNSFGNSVILTIFGESHGSAIGAVIDGLAPGIKIDEELIKSQLDLRRPFGKISTSRVEEDEFEIVSGLFEGKTTGTPLTIIIPNENTKSKDYSKTKDIARPGHADFTANVKYNGFQDYRGGGHFSGRITAAVVAAGAIFKQALKAKGILIGTHIKKLADIEDENFNDYASDIKKLNEMKFAVLDDEKSKEMVGKIEEAQSEGDSVGGILETCILNAPLGLGEPWFDSVESVLSHAIFAIPGIKGIEFGAGFEISNLKGSQANDAFRMNGEKIVTKTNNNGGINGGITNGMPIIFRCAVKPTPSIFKEQESVDFKKKENVSFSLEGRHDPAIIHRARVVVDSISAFVIMDMLASKNGTDYFCD